MDLSGNCPHAHCLAELTVRVRKDETASHVTCAECGWPMLIRRTARGWVSERGHWGPAGDDGVFHEVVCDLFHAEMGSVNLGPDCYSGILDGTLYNHIEAKCHAAPVGASLVDEVIDKYGGRSVSLAIVAGSSGFREGAIDLAVANDTHLFEVIRTLAGYGARRVA